MKMTLVAAVCFATIMVCGSVFGQTGEPRASEPRDLSESPDLSGAWGIGYKFGFINEENERRDLDVDFGHSLGVSWMFSENLGIEVEGAYLMGDDDVGRDDTANAVFGDLLLMAPLENFSPYLRAGMGLQHSGSVSDLVSQIDDSFSGRLGGGVEFYMNESVAFNTEFLYTASGYDLPDYWQYRAGIKWYIK